MFRIRKTHRGFSLSDLELGFCCALFIMKEQNERVAQPHKPSRKFIPRFISIIKTLYRQGVVTLWRHMFRVCVVLRIVAMYDICHTHSPTVLPSVVSFVPGKFHFASRECLYSVPGRGGGGRTNFIRGGSARGLNSYPFIYLREENGSAFAFLQKGYCIERSVDVRKMFVRPF